MVEVKRIRAPSDIMVKLDEFAAAVETAKSLAETKHFRTVYVIEEADAKRAIGQPRPR